MTSSPLSALPWVNHFQQLGTDFYSTVEASPLKNPYWVHVNDTVAKYIGIPQDAMRTPDTLAVFSGAQKCNPYPDVAMVYAGHQFGGYSPRLGDGRGLLIGQLALKDSLIDLHLKGAGKTPYSRFGDGRAVLRSSIREYLAGEAMHALGIPTSRALCITASQDPVIRETVETAAMVTRIAKTHIRFGHFEYFHYTEQWDQLKQLANHVIEQFLPEYKNKEDRYEALLRYSVQHTATMIAQWQAVGFAHGVMNTDNMSIIGESLDYGPYGFLDDYEPGFICNHSDYQGRYAFDQQPSMGLWNLNALAHAFSSLLSHHQINDALATYEPILVDHYAHLMRQKLGFEKQHKEDKSLCSSLLQLMAEDKVDYTLFFRQLCFFTSDDLHKSPDNNASPSHTTQNHTALEPLFQQQEKWHTWQNNYQQRLTLESRTDAERQQCMRNSNPKFILRNYLLQQAIEKAQQDDFSMIGDLMNIIQHPFDEHEAFADYAKAPPPSGKHLAISCSS